MPMTDEAIHHILDQLMTEASISKPNSEPVECWEERGARKPHSKNRSINDTGYSPMSGRGKHSNITKNVKNVTNRLQHNERNNN